MTGQQRPINPLEVLAIQAQQRREQTRRDKMRTSAEMFMENIFKNQMRGNDDWLDAQYGIDPKTTNYDYSGQGLNIMGKVRDSLSHDPIRMTQLQDKIDIGNMKRWLPKPYTPPLSTRIEEVRPGRRVTPKRSV